MRSLLVLSPDALDALARYLRQIPTGCAWSHNGLRQIAGAASVESVAAELRRLEHEGWTLAQISESTDALAEAMRSRPTPDDMFELVLSGPDVPGVPTRDTLAVFHSLVEQAREEIILVGYAVYNGVEIFARLAERMAENPVLRVRFYLNIERPRGDTRSADAIVAEWRSTFFSRHWPWAVKPEIYYDPRSLDPDAAKRASLHAKCVIVDTSTMLITSANFTPAALTRNLEVGVMVFNHRICHKVTDAIRTCTQTL